MQFCKLFFIVLEANEVEPGSLLMHDVGEGRLMLRATEPTHIIRCGLSVYVVLSDTVLQETKLLITKLQDNVGASSL